MAQLDGYLTHKARVLAQRRELFQTEPEAALVRLRATSYCAGTTGVRPVRMGDYVVISDSAPGLAGNSLGPSSPEMLLGALASCLVHTYLLQASLLDIPLDSVEVEVRGALDMTGVVGLPVEGTIRLEQVSYTPHVVSAADAATVAHLHEMVDRTCAVLNTLRTPVTVERIQAELPAGN